MRLLRWWFFSLKKAIKVLSVMQLRVDERSEDSYVGRDGFFSFF